MHTELCDRLGIEFPVFAFSHCRDVVAAVTKAGGFGVLGALAYPAAQLEHELKWIDSQVGDKPYGVDIVIPGKYEGMGEVDPVKLEQQLIAAIPQQHRAFVDKILERHGIPDLPAEEKGGSDLLGWTAATAAPTKRMGRIGDGCDSDASTASTPSGTLPPVPSCRIARSRS